MVAQQSLLERDCCELLGRGHGECVPYRNLYSLVFSLAYLYCTGLMLIRCGVPWAVGQPSSCEDERGQAARHTSAMVSLQ